MADCMQAPRQALLHVTYTFNDHINYLCFTT